MSRKKIHEQEAPAVETPEAAGNFGEGEAGTGAQPGADAGGAPGGGDPHPHSEGGAATDGGATGSGAEAAGDANTVEPEEPSPPINVHATRFEMALAMVGILPEEWPEGFDVDDVATTLYDFWTQWPDAPLGAGLQQVKMRHAIVMDFGGAADVQDLALDIFRHAVTGLNTLIATRAAGEARALQAAHDARGIGPLDADDKSFEQEDGGLLAPSELGKRVAQQTS